MKSTISQRRATFRSVLTHRNIRLMSMRLEPYVFWKRYDYWVCKPKLGSIRRPPLNCTHGAGSPPVGNHPFLPQITLCRGQVVWLLDHRKLPGSLWTLCLQWNSFQPRITIAWRNICDVKDYEGCSTDCARPARETVFRQSQRIERLGPRKGLRRSYVPYPSAG